MNEESNAVLFNAVPLLVLAALCLVVSATLAPALWRERRRRPDADFATALMFPFVAVAAGIAGVVTLVERAPLAGNVWLGLVAIGAGYPPALIFLANWADRRLALTGPRRAREAEERGSARERHLGAVSRLSTALVGAEDSTTIARLLLDEVAGLFGAGVVAFADVADDGRSATFLLAREGDTDADWLTGTSLDLVDEPSGIASAVADGAPFAVYDAPSSTRVNRRLVERTGTRSAAFVPQFAEGRVAGVLVVGSREPRVFSFEELELLRALVAEAGLALDRQHSAAELAAALERERLVSRIAAHLRSELDLDAVLDVVVSDVGEALSLSRCFVRLGDGGAVAAEWRAEGVEPIAERSPRLPVTNLAEIEGRTVAIGDIASTRRIDEEGRELLLSLGAAAVLATPVAVHGEPIGVLALHRGEAGPWPAGTVTLAEAVAREAGLAIHLAQLLAENRRRLAETGALLDASQALTSELGFEAVIDRIAEELTRLLGADAADCWILEEGPVLRCRAVRGLPDGEVGRTIAPAGTIAEAISAGKPVLERRSGETEPPRGSASYAGFAEVMDAPISTRGNVRGVLGVCSRRHGRFDEADLTLLEAFARVAGIALRNAEAFEQSTRQEQVQRGFFRIASVLGEPLSAAATLDAVAQAAADALGGSAAAVLKPVGTELVLAGGHELQPLVRELLEAGTSAAPLGDAAHEQRIVVAPRLVEDERFDEVWRDAARRAGNEALLAVPLAELRGQRGGLVVVFFAEHQAFADEDLELARQVAVAARGALERSELYELERRSRALAQQLAETGRELAAQLDPAGVLDEVVRQAPALLRADGSSLRLLDGDELVLEAATGPGAGAMLGSREPSTAWLAGDIVQSRSPATIADARADVRSADADPLLSAGGYGAYLGVPLVAPDGSAQGVLGVLSRRPREWRQEEIEALQALARNAASALANAELYRRVELDKERSEAILANVADGIVAVNREGTVVLWNAAAERITGVPASEALGRTPALALGRPLAGEEPSVPGRLVPIRRGSEDVWLSLTEAVMSDPAGAVAGRIFAFRDISDERVVEELKSDFVSTVSHELRTPLTSIYGFAETLLREDVHFGEDERRMFLQYISSESERLTTIVDTLLSVARVDAGEVPVQLAPTDVGAVVSEAVRTAEASQAADNGHRFETRLPSEPLDAEADGEKVRQVLGILLDNAVRYSPDGGTVVVDARRGARAVEVRVRDEGIGIPAAERERIFRKFYRGEGGSRMIGTGNAGLGLFIAEGLVTAMGGRIWVDSTEGEGSTFVVELPPARTEN